jgi:outer membrane protein OmpA-like peptidoglycan-associated protein
MKKILSLAIVAVFVSFLSLPQISLSQIKEGSIEVEPFIGGYFLDHQQDKFGAGLRAGYNFLKNWGVEGAFDIGGHHAQFYHADLVYHILPDQKLVPLVFAGLGVDHLEPFDKSHTRMFGELGVGAKYFFTDNIAARADIRGIQDKYTHMAMTLGVVFTFGGKQPTHVEAAPVEPTPVPAAPTVSLSASPATIDQGQCTTLTWLSENASNAAIDQGIGSVDLKGSKKICPMKTTEYTITAQGMGGSQTAATTVVVNPPPPPPPAPKVIDKMTLHVLFDFDKSTHTEADLKELQKAVAFVKKYPGSKIRVDGHTDWIGSDAYNMKLSERRAATVKNYLIKEAGVDPANITAVGHGKREPVANNKTDAGRAQNRRVEIAILSD